MKKGFRKIARTSAKSRPVTPTHGAPGYEGLVGEIGILLDQLAGYRPVRSTRS